MTKSVIKEIIIMLLVCIAILLILGVLFYDYIPSNKSLPNKVAYTTPENISQELSEDVNNETMINITYQLDDTQLDVSKKNKQYDPGKQNPFDTIQIQESQNGNTTTNTAGSVGGTTNSGTTTNGQNGTQRQNTNSNSGGSQTQGHPDADAYLPTGGAK